LQAELAGLPEDCSNLLFAIPLLKELRAFVYICLAVLE